MSQRIVIIGNSGSGKSVLARALAGLFELPVISLDSIFWLPGGFSQKRAPEERNRMIVDARSKPAWIVEGVFGDLAEQFLDHADLLIWLDLPWEVCRSGLVERGSESSRQNNPVQAEVSFRALLVWSSEYWTRTDMRSFLGHERLFSSFKKARVRFLSRTEIDIFLKNQQPNQALEPTLTAVTDRAAHAPRQP
jgi:adenylate kinase family enzyme